MTTIISVKIPEPQFEGQTKSKLGNPNVKPAVENVFADGFAIFLEEHPKDAEAIVSVRRVQVVMDCSQFFVLEFVESNVEVSKMILAD